MSRDQLLTLPTLLTLLRIFMIPTIVRSLMNSSYKAGFCLLIGALITDAIDGAIARYLKQESYMGQLLDPVADKIFMGSLITVFAFEWVPHYSLPFWFWQLFMGKELLLVCGALYVMKFHDGHAIKAGFWGKASMILQGLLIVFLAWQLMQADSYRMMTHFLIIINSLVIVVAFCAYLNQLPFFRRLLCPAWLLRFWPS